MTPQEAYVKLKERNREIAVLGSTEAVLYWDRESYMPPRADDHRAEQLAQISRLTHEWFTDPQVGDWLAAVEESDLVGDGESETAVNVREWRRMYDRETKLPSEFVQEFARVTSRAGAVWADARKKSDFSIYRPDLEKIVALCRRKADYIGYETDAYDALLDEFEPGARVAEVEKVMADLRVDLVDLIGKIADAPRRPDPGVLKRSFDVAKQRVFSEAVASAMGYDFQSGRFDEAVHPCCNAMGPRDVRVLTRYYPEDFVEGLSGAMHEAGHAIYDMTRKDDKHWGTPFDETASLGIHESQSRLWENMVGRSREFWVHFFPRLRQMFYRETSDITLDGVYGAMNHVTPSYIRVEADETTYNLHVMLRFELERAIISGDVAVADIPGEWNRRFKDYLGFEVDNDAHGCLQDVHWSDGIFGYFPTYALGNLYAAQFWAQAQEDLPGLLDDFTRGEFHRLFDWLGRNIHDKGFRYYSPELCQKVTGAPLSHRPLIDYLYDKYEDIYGITRR